MEGMALISPLRVSIIFQFWRLVSLDYIIIEEIFLGTDTSLTMDAASRYAKALFAIGIEYDCVEEFEKSLNLLAVPLENDENLKSFISSPLYSRNTQIDVMSKICKTLKLDSNITSTVLLMASKRRLFAIASMIQHFKNLCRTHRNEVVVEVTSAHPLSKKEKDRVEKLVRSNIDSEVLIHADCDPSILGGLILKIGSKMVDTSIKSKINKLRNKLKEVG